MVGVRLSCKFVDGKAGGVAGCVCVCVLHGWLRLLHGESPRDAGVSRERKSIQIQRKSDKP